MAGIASLSLTGTASAHPNDDGNEGTGGSSSSSVSDDFDFSRRVNVVEAGADNTGNRSITPVLEKLRADDTLFYFPEGEYYIDSVFRFTGASNVGFVGDGATLKPARNDRWTGRARDSPKAFRLGVHYAPMGNVLFEGFEIDQTANNTGGQPLEIWANDNLVVRDLEYVGRHDGPGWANMVAGTRNGGTGLIENVSMPDGGEDPGSGDGRGATGILLSHYHSGSITVRDCVLGGYPDNGLYCSGPNGHVVVEGGLYKNSDSANVRLRGDNSVIDGTTFVCDQDREGFVAQRPLRFDSGTNMVARNIEIDCDVDVLEAVRVRHPAKSVTIENADITISDRVRAGIHVSRGGSATIKDVDISGGRYGIHGGGSARTQNVDYSG